MWQSCILNTSLIPESIIINMIYVSANYNTVKFWNLKIYTTSNSIKNIKFLGINLTKDVQDLHTENYKMLLKEIKDNLNEHRIIRLMEQTLNIVKMSFITNLFIDSMQSQSK